MNKRWLIRGVIVVGGLASVATSQLPGWSLTGQAPLAPSQLDHQTPALRYLVHAELRGPGPFEGLDGWIAARIDVAPSQPTAVTSIEIRSLTHPDEMPGTGTVPADRSHEDVYIDAWLECAADPCAEDYEVTIQRDPSLDLPVLAITGSIEAYAGGPSDAKQMPVDSEVVVSVSGPM